MLVRHTEVRSQNARKLFRGHRGVVRVPLEAVGEPDVPNQQVDLARAQLPHPRPRKMSVPYAKLKKRPQTISSPDRSIVRQ